MFLYLKEFLNKAVLSLKNRKEISMAKFRIYKPFYYIDNVQVVLHYVNLMAYEARRAE